MNYYVEIQIVVTLIGLLIAFYTTSKAIHNRWEIKRQGVNGIYRAIANERMWTSLAFLMLQLAFFTSALWMQIHGFDARTPAGLLASALITAVITYRWRIRVYLERTMNERTTNTTN